MPHSQISLSGCKKDDTLLGKRRTIPTEDLILAAMLMFRMARNAIPNSTFINKVDVGLENDDDDPFTALGEVEEDPIQTTRADLESLKEKYGVNGVDTNPDDYIDFDREISTTHIEMSDKDIPDEVTGQSQNASEDEEENEENVRYDILLCFICLIPLI